MGTEKKKNVAQDGATQERKRGEKKKGREREREKPVDTMSVCNRHRKKRQKRIPFFLHSFPPEFRRRPFAAMEEKAANACHPPPDETLNRGNSDATVPSHGDGDSPPTHGTSGSQFSLIPPPSDAVSKLMALLATIVCGCLSAVLMWQSEWQPAVAMAFTATGYFAIFRLHATNVDAASVAMYIYAATNVFFYSIMLSMDAGLQTYFYIIIVLPSGVFITHSIARDAALGVFAIFIFFVAHTVEGAFSEQLRWITRENARQLYFFVQLFGLAFLLIVSTVQRRVHAGAMLREQSMVRYNVNFLWYVAFVVGAFGTIAFGVVN